MTEEVHIPAKETTQDNSMPSISEQDNSYKENIDVLQTDKSQQNLNGIRKDSKSGFFGFSLTRKSADRYKKEREIEKIKHEAEMKLHKQLSSVEQKFKSQITQLENRVVSQSACVENLQNSLKKTEAERNSFKSQLEKKSSESDEENKRLQISLGKVGAERDSFMDQLEKRSSEKERSDKEMSEEIKRLQFSVAEAERDSQRAANSNHEALMSRISQLENVIKTEEILKSSLAKTKAERDSFKTKLEQKISESDEENKRLQISLAKVGAERDSFKEQLEKSEKESSDKENSEEIKRLQISLAKAEAKNKNHEALMARISQLQSVVVDVVKVENKENLKISGDVQRIVTEKFNTLISINNKRPEMTVRARFTEVSKLTSDKVYSQSTELAGINWRISVRKNNDSLAFFIEGRKENAAKWSCSTFAEYQLISPESGEIVESCGKSDGCAVHDETFNWGYEKYISFKDLFNEEKGYVKDDSILLAVVIRIFPTA